MCPWAPQKGIQCNVCSVAVTAAGPILLNHIIRFPTNLALRHSQKNDPSIKLRDHALHGLLRALQQQLPISRFLMHRVDLLSGPVYILSGVALH